MLPLALVRRCAGRPPCNQILNKASAAMQAPVAASPGVRTGSGSGNGNSSSSTHNPLPLPSYPLSRQQAPQLFPGKPGISAYRLGKRQACRPPDTPQAFFPESAWELEQGGPSAQLGPGCGSLEALDGKVGKTLHPASRGM
jgi:hypothetical protein